MKCFIEFVSQYDPNFPYKIQGASDSEITRFEQLIGRPLPTFCRDYLSRMGHEHGGIDIGRNDAKTDIGTLIKYYEECEGEEVPPESIIIVADGYLISQVSLQCNGSDEPKVNFSDGEEIESLYVESLEKLLYRMIYMKYHFKSFPFAACYVGSMKANRAEPARELALELGFKPHWFSDVIALCADRTDAAIWILPGEKVPSASVAAQERGVIEEIGHLMFERAGLEFDSWGIADLVA